MNGKPPGPAKNHSYSYIIQASLICSIRTRKRKYPVLKINTKFYQLIKHAEISYYIASLVFYRFSCLTYSEVPQGWGTPDTSKSMRRVSYWLNYFVCLIIITLLEICILVYLCTGCGTLKIHLCLEDNRSSFSRVGLKSETKDTRLWIAVLFCLRKITKTSENKNWRHQTAEEEQIYMWR